MSWLFPRKWESCSICESFITRASRGQSNVMSSFFTYYHPFLPFLDPKQSPEDYYNASSLLFWTIISVGARRYQGDSTLLNSLAGPVSRLVWSTLADIPQSYHVVKALALMCSWPFPTSSTSTDPTFMLCGMMVQVAMQLGLHRPSHTQDFSKFRVELIEEELRDKVRTWAICNIVAQRYVNSLLFSEQFSCVVTEYPRDMGSLRPLCTTGHFLRVTRLTRTSNSQKISGQGWRSRNSATELPGHFTRIGVIRLVSLVITNDLQ